MRVIVFTALAMIAFAGNSLLCRIALRDTPIDAASFTSIRLLAGALTLWALVQLQSRPKPVGRGNWISALALFAYAVAFSFAYRDLSAATGALLLFGAVQITMIGYGLSRGERLRGWQLVGMALALAGLVGLLLPGLSAPPMIGASLMLCAGVAWGIYSLRGKGTGDPLRKTAGNFLRTVPITLVFSGIALSHVSLDANGVIYAVASGAITSGIGYAIWYAALPKLKSTSAATVQLSVPVIAAAGGVMFLAEPITMRLMLASVAVLFGIWLVIRKA